MPRRARGPSGPDAIDQDRLHQHVNGYRVDVVDPLQTLRIAMAETEGIAVDLTWNGREAELFDDGTRPPVAPLVTPRIGITKAADLPRRWMLPRA